MPLKLNVGISKKIGLPDYGSLGTTCNVEVEVDGRLIFDDLDGFAIADAFDDLPRSILHGDVHPRNLLFAGERLTGLLDWRLGREPGGTDTPFTLYLQRGERGQSWRLARPQGPDDGGLEQQWLIDPLPLPG